MALIAGCFHRTCVIRGGHSQCIVWVQGAHLGSIRGEDVTHDYSRLCGAFFYSIFYHFFPIAVH